MADQNELERLYREAQAALKAKEYDRAVGLLTQILVIDENYKDVSRLLAQTVKLKRRRWYSHPALWGMLGFVVLIGLGIWLSKVLPRETATSPLASTVTPSMTAVPATATMTLTPTATPVPLTWKRVSIGQEFERDKIIAFEIDPKDRDVLYVSMENAGFYQSIDGGISWRPIQIESVPTDISRQLITHDDYDRLKEEIITNIGPDGKERSYNAFITPNWRVSEDGGKTWSEFGIIGKPESKAITFDSQGSIYVYCASHLCRYSPDGIQKVTLGEPDVGAFTIITISPFDPNIIYVAGNGLSVSRDAGVTWSKLNNGLGTMLLTMQTGEGNPPTLYLLQMEDCDSLGFSYITNRNRGPEPGQPVYASTNGGQTWDLVSQTGCYIIKDADGVTLYRIARAIQFCEGCENPDGWVWRSQDGGRVWRKVIALHAYWNLLTLVAHPTQSGTLFALNQADAPEQFMSKDYGNSWEKVNPPLGIKSCYGSTLQFIDAYRPMAIDPFDGNHAFVIDNGTLRESHDSCDTTSAFGTAPNTNMNSIAFDLKESDTLYAGTDEGAYVSYDSGTTWGQVNDGLLGATVVYSIAVDKESNVYAATPYGVFKLESR